MQSEFFFGVFGLGVRCAGAGVRGAGVLTTTGFVAVGCVVGFGVVAAGTFAAFCVGEAEGEGVAVLLVVGDALAVGEGVGSVVPALA
jgi:hypothetical protein